MVRVMLFLLIRTKIPDHYYSGLFRSYITFNGAIKVAWIY